MTQNFQCPYCGTAIAVDSAYAGKTCMCPHCTQQLQIPYSQANYMPATAYPNTLGDTMPPVSSDAITRLLSSQRKSSALPQVMAILSVVLGSIAFLLSTVAGLKAFKEADLTWEHWKAVTVMFAIPPLVMGIIGLIGSRNEKPNQRRLIMTIIGITLSGAALIYLATFNGFLSSVTFE